jgi:CoA:oxalate CoA-transferase
MSGPLEGIRVLDLSRILSGPYCTMTLSDMGAEVIKVERPEVGDRSRGIGPFMGNQSSYFMSINRGKKSVTIDIFNPDGRSIITELIRQSDILVENFVPGIMRRLDLHYEAVQQINPSIIYASITGFGQDGPYGQKPAMDIVVQAMGGMMSITGAPDGPPVRSGSSMGDITAGLFTAIAILGALEARHKSGNGQKIDISMLDCQLAIQENAITRYLHTGEIPGPLGSRHSSATPFQAFKTKNGWIVVAMIGGEIDRWGLFCNAIDHPDLIEDPRFAENWIRTQNYSQLEPIFNEALKRKTSEEWLSEFESLGIVCGPVNNISQVVEDPQVRHRQMITKVNHTSLGKIDAINTPLRFSETPALVEQGAPELGEHTDQVLGNILGIGERELDRLRSKGAI